MKKISPGQLLATGAVGFLIFFWGVEGISQDQKTPATEGGAPRRPQPFVAGFSTCANGCHDLEKTPVNQAILSLCRRIEMGIWEGDKHKYAYMFLLSRFPDGKENPKGRLAKEMGERLGIKDVSTDVRCLACHSVNVPDPGQLSKSFDRLKDGVTCVVCHGMFRDWIDVHSPNVPEDREKWRNYSREKKEKEFGMKDLWNPATRTKLCVSCHVGNAADKKLVKFVTHEMYAAGHPPLPGIEIATFSDQMPKHWKYIKEKDEVVQKLILGKEARSQEFEKTQLVVVSSITTLASALGLLADQATACKNADGAEEQVLDFALLDCYACHHDLKTPSWRQQRGYRGKPGRPQLRSWPTALARISLQELQGEEEGKKLEEGLQKLYQAFNSKPYGSCGEVASLARQLAESLTKIGEQMAGEKDTKRYGDKAPNLLQRLCSNEETLDYDAARQVAWAIEIILEEWNCNKDKEPEVQQVLGTLKKNLKLDLPAGKDRSIEGELADSLRKLNEYNPDEFKRGLKKMVDLLPKTR